LQSTLLAAWHRHRCVAMGRRRVVVVVGKYPRYPTNDGKNPRDDDMNV